MLYKIIIVWMSVATLVVLGGCTKFFENDTLRQEVKQYDISERSNAEKMVLRLYESAYSDGQNNEDETVKQMVEALGEKGYVAVDSDNKLDLTCAEQLEEFIEMNKTMKTGSIMVFRILYSQSFYLYEFFTEDGTVSVQQEYYQYVNHDFQKSGIVEYEASVFDYTEEGYLFVEGTWDSQDKYVLSLDSEEEHIALRIKPMDRKCQELNERYILPVSYGLNNVFLTNWNQNDYGNLDIYDIFALFYEQIHGWSIPYQMNQDLSIGEEFDIPREEFETVVLSHFKIDQSELRSTLRYDTNNETYLYRPRGFYEHDYAEIPYPEVVSFEENEDGTLSLIVNAVYPLKNTSKLFSHKVTVLEEGNQIYYLSNEMLGDEFDFWWHSNRYTDEEWKELYDNDMNQSSEENINRMFAQVEESIFSQDEKTEIENEIIQIVHSVWNQYSDVELCEGTFYSSGIKTFTKDQRLAVVKTLGAQGVVAVSDDIEMVNGNLLKDFYDDYKNQKESEITVYDIYQDGLICAITFAYKNKILQSYYVGIKPNKKREPELTGKTVKDIEDINYTDKGYFFYKNTYVIEHASLRNYWRVQPLSEECKRLSEKYLAHLNYQKYNLMVIDWNKETVSEILLPGMFEDFYLIKYDQVYTESNEKIPGNLFEEIMTSFLPVSVEQLRSAYTYDETNHTYKQDIIYNQPYPPFGEVVDYNYNADGTITLYADTIWPDKNSDHAFTNIITIQPIDESTFCILSNDVEEGELELPPIAYQRGGMQ